MRIYFDNNATTALDPLVAEMVSLVLSRDFGNASSVHEEGRRARRLLEEARESVALLVHSDPRQIVFTSGGTESNNAAIYGVLLSAVDAVPYGRSGYGIVTTGIEHPSVLEPVRELGRRGHPVSIVAPGRDGVVSAEKMIEAIGPHTRLVSVMLANNETGALQPVAEVARFCRERKIHIHCDAVQAGGRIDVDPEALGVDTLSLSAHKMHGPKGIGALWLRNGTTLHPILAGGAQERRRRAGTENVPLAAGFGVAATLAREALETQPGALRDRLEQTICTLFPEAVINSGDAPRIGNTTNLCFRGADAEGIVIGMDLAGVALSTGSACSSGRVEPSHVLLAMQLSEEDCRSSVRISLSRLTLAEEVDRAIELFRLVVPRNRRAVVKDRFEVEQLTGGAP